MKALLVFAFLITPLQAADRWPGFLGAGAIQPPADSVPVKWSPTENTAWSVPTPGYGQSSPVVWGGHVYVTAVEGPEKESLHVVCCSLKTGEVLWARTRPSGFPQKNSVYISRAAPTPVVDEKGIYAYFESGDVIALSHSGELQWQISLTERYGAPVNEFGLAASPAQLDDRVVILVDDKGPSYLTAISKRDGSEIWKTDRTSRSSWSSPMLVPVGESVQVVCSSAGSVDGYDVKTGQQLWTYDQVGGNTNTSPLPIGDGTFLIAGSPGREGENSELAKKSNGLFIVDRTDGAWNPHFEWINSAATSSWGSPIRYKGFAYWVNRSGVVYCLDAKTGAEAYTKRLKQSCWATPVGIGDRIYFFGKDGTTTVLASGGEFNVLAENVLWEEDSPPVNNVPVQEETTEERRRGAAMFSRPTVYGVALADQSILLRTGSKLFCIRASLGKN